MIRTRNSASTESAAKRMLLYIPNVVMRPVNRIFLSATACCMLMSSAALAADVEIRVLSGRADMVTGGDALVETNAPLEKFNARLNGQDITKSFRPGKTAGTL